MIRDNYSCWFILNFFICLFVRFSNTLDIYTNMVNGPENFFSHLIFPFLVTIFDELRVKTKWNKKKKFEVKSIVFRIIEIETNIQLLTFFIFLSFGTWIKPRCRHQSSYLGWMDGPQLHITTTVISWISKHTRS